jgi:L-cysteine desulfidase
MSRLDKNVKVESLQDLEDLIYEAAGTIDMEDVRLILDVIKANKHLLEEHK